MVAHSESNEQSHSFARRTTYRIKTTTQTAHTTIAHTTPVFLPICLSVCPLSLLCLLQFVSSRIRLYSESLSRRPKQIDQIASLTLTALPRAETKQQQTQRRQGERKQEKGRKELNKLLSCLCCLLTLRWEREATNSFCCATVRPRLNRPTPTKPPTRTVPTKRFPVLYVCVSKSLLYVRL